MASGKYPMGERPSQTSASRVVECSHCRGPIALGGWEKINGFLVECPHCHGFHGKRWNIRVVAFASLLLNALSFFFTMRPARAFAAAVAWCLAIYLVIPRTETWPDGLQATIFGLIFLGPLLINMGLLVRHQVDFDRHPTGARVV